MSGSGDSRSNDHMPDDNEKNQKITAENIPQLPMLNFLSAGGSFSNADDLRSASQSQLFSPISASGIVLGQQRSQTQLNRSNPKQPAATPPNPAYFAMSPGQQNIDMCKM